MNMTQNIKHHLSDSILMAYAAGTLPEAFNLLVAAHVSICDTCRAQAGSYDALGGEVLEHTHTADVAANSLASTLALIAGGPIDVPISVRAKDSVLPGPLVDYIGGNLDAVRWKPIGMGVKQAILPTSKDASARLLLIPAGTAMPDHGHHGTEMTMVLKGAFQDEDDYFARGDVEIADSDIHHTPVAVEIADSDIHHTPVADIHEDCVCLAVADAPLQFDRLLPRIAQRFLRI